MCVDRYAIYIETHDNRHIPIFYFSFEFLGIKSVLFESLIHIKWKRVRVDIIGREF